MVKRQEFNETPLEKLQLEEFFRSEIEKSHHSTYQSKYEYARLAWEASRERESVLRKKTENILPFPTLLLSLLIGGGIITLVLDVVATPWATLILSATLVTVFLLGLASLYYGYKALSVSMAFEIHPGVALENHEGNDNWIVAAAAQHLAKVKSELPRLKRLAFRSQLARDFALLMVATALIGTVITFIVSVAERGLALENSFMFGLLGGLVIWVALMILVANLPKEYEKP